MLEQLSQMDMALMLGFFMALALRRGRIDGIIEGFLSNDIGAGSSNDRKEPLPAQKPKDFQKEGEK